MDRAVLHLAAIVASSDDAIVSKDLDGVIQSWNRAAERMFGYDASEVVGRSIRVIIPLERWPEEDMVLGRIRRGEPVEHFETIRMRKDGTLFPVSLTVSPIRTADGVIIGASKIARDISERVQAEAALREAEAGHADLRRRLLALMAASGNLLQSPRPSDVVAPTFALARNLVTADAHAMWRHDSRTGSWSVLALEGISRAFAGAVLALPGAALPTEPLVVQDVDAAPLLERRREAYASEGIRSLLAVPLAMGEQGNGTLVFYYRKPHTFTEAEVQTAQALGNLAAVAITTATLHDELRRNHEDADRARLRAEFLAHISAVLGQALDYEGTLRRVARLAVPELADWCAVDVVDARGRIRRLAVEHVDPSKVEQARSFSERFPADRDAPRGVYEVIRSGQPWMLSEITDDLVVANARGPEHLAAIRELGIVALMVVPLIARGRILGALTFASTDPGRRYAQADLQFVQDVAFRAALAMDNALAYDEANRANRAKDQFVATLSHELRTPLNAILGWAQMLLRPDLPADQRQRAAEVIVRSAKAQNQLLSDIFDMAAIVQGKLRLSMRPVELRTILESVRDVAAPAASAKRISMALALPPDRVLVHGDADRLQQVFSNLLYNAVKFTPEDGRVDVCLEVRDRHADVSISDTGIGISPDILPYVFDRFRQGDAATAPELRGLGLGLAIVKQLVDGHGGTVTASSPGDGQGSTFVVRLPLAQP